MQQRPIKSCTNCRQQKIRCNAAQTYPEPCSRCAKYGRKCSVDPLFKPRRGGQVELLREDIKRLENRLADLQHPAAGNSPRMSEPPNGNGASPHQQHISRPVESLENTQSLVPPQGPPQPLPTPQAPMVPGLGEDPPRVDSEQRLVIVPTAGPYLLDNVTLSQDQAERLHTRFMSQYWPFLPIFESNNAPELYSQSETLFWTVMCSAALSEPTPDIYLSIITPLRRLVTRVTLDETPRSTHIVQALLVLSTWPLPNEKVLDDTSHRYLSLARSLGLQLGMHRGQFIYEFSRKQKMMPNAVRWRTRTWLYTYVAEQFLSATLGVPSNMPVDYIIDAAPADPEMRMSPATCAVIKLATFYSKMSDIMGGSLDTPDGLMDARSRAPTLDILSHDLRELLRPQDYEHEPLVEILYLYMRCLLGSFAFLPDTPEQDQTRFIVGVVTAATRIVTLVRGFVGQRRISEFPSFVRQATSFSALVLFRLQLLPQFPQQYVDSARQSVVTVHHLYRNVPMSWGTVQNDITRIAKLLESLNYVLITHPYLLASHQIMKRMRSHLTSSLFYELLWTVHEARRRNTRKRKSGEEIVVDGNLPKPLQAQAVETQVAPMALQNENLKPLPLFSQISTDAYTSSTVVSPNGTTQTKLIPTEPPASSTQPPLPPLDGIDQLLQGLDWMNYEGDDFLGWMPNAEMGF